MNFNKEERILKDNKDLNIEPVDYLRSEYKNYILNLEITNF